MVGRSYGEARSSCADCCCKWIIKFCGFSWVNRLPGYFCYVGNEFFWSASLPIMEAITLSHLGERTDKYGRIRSWGSVGFVLAVVGIGYFLQSVEIIWLLWIILGLKFGILIFLIKFLRRKSSTIPQDCIRYGRSACVRKSWLFDCQFIDVVCAWRVLYVFLNLSG